MAAIDVIVGSLQQPSPAMGSSSLISIKHFHLRSYKRRPFPPLLASMASKEDHGATLHKDQTSEERSSYRTSISSLLKAVQESHGSNAVIQQVSSLRHFFMPELPFAIITEMIKKRMPLSFRENDEEEMHSSHDLSGGLIVDKEPKEQLLAMGPRCAWPRAKLTMSVEEAEQAEALQGPRCAWPRGSGYALKLQEEDVLAEVATSGAKCAWPRATSKNLNQNGSMSAQEDNIVTLKSSTKDATGLSIKLKSVSTRLEESSSHIIEGPRCAWPRGSSTPRRMLATSVGLGIMNYMFIGLGAPALAIILESRISNTCEEDDSLSPHKSLLP